jgi:phosphatidylglycerophosphate synthase
MTSGVQLADRVDDRLAGRLAAGLAGRLADPSGGPCAAPSGGRRAALSDGPPAAPGAGRGHGPTVGLLAQIALVAALASGVGLGPVGWLAATAYAVVGWVALSAGLRRSGAGSLGAANRVTLVRATLIVGVTALVADHVASGVAASGTVHVVLITLASVALVLDGVDGYVARRTGTSSPLGARFDMETDAFLILVLSVLVAGTFGWWTAAIGLLRYAFVVAARLLPWLRASLPPRFSRKTVAAVQGVVLVVAASGVVWRPVALAAVASALALLLWSFGRDIAWLYRRRRSMILSPITVRHADAGTAFGLRIMAAPRRRLPGS